MSNEKKVRCVHLNVRCKSNSLLEIRCGGPDFLGFDFYVQQKDVKKIKRFIVKEIRVFDLPFIGIVCEEEIDINPSKIATKKSIHKAIKKGAKRFAD